MTEVGRIVESPTFVGGSSFWDGFRCYLAFPWFEGSPFSGSLVFKIRQTLNSRSNKAPTIVVQS